MLKQLTILGCVLMMSFFGCGAMTAADGGVLDAGASDAGSEVDCGDIIAACHAVDPGTGDIHECHEQAETLWSGSECASNKSRCRMLCANAAQDGGP
jgi:hypothetical protein